MMTNDSSSAVRWLVILALCIATAGMFLISMRANYLYGRSIGQTPDTQVTLAWANVGADIWKACGIIVVTALWRNRWRRAALATAITWCVCLAFSISSAIGIYVQERAALTGGREAKHAAYEDTRKERADVEDKLKDLARHRSVNQVEAAIANILARPVIVGDRVRGTVGALSANCSKDDKRTAEACAEIAQLREELAVAYESTKLQGRASTLRQQMANLRGETGTVAPDPVGEFWAWVSRGWVSVSAVGFGLPLFFAFMIETVSAFGPLAIVAYAEATRRQVTGNLSPSVATGRDLSRHAAVGRGDATFIESATGRAVQFMADRTEPTGDSAAISNEELHADYEVWCFTNALHPLSREVFTAVFDRVREVPQLEGKIRKFGGRYYGIRLVNSKVATLPSRKRSDK